MVGGTTGESATLSDAELMELLERARGAARGRAALIAGAGTSSTATTVERARRLSAGGVDALLVVTPAYNKPTQEGLYRHFEAVAAASAVPVVLYNVPARTAVDLLPATVARLAQLPRIVAVKEAVARCRARARAGRCRPASSSPCCRAMMRRAAEAMLNGARGVISVTANVVPEGDGAAVRGGAARRSRRGRAHRCAAARAARGAVRRAQSDSGEVGAWREQGLIDRGIRLPLTELSEPLRARVRAALDSRAGADAAPLTPAKSA